MTTMAPKFSKDQVKAFVRDPNFKTMQGVQSALKELFADTLQEMLEAELQHDLCYAKHNVANKETPNTRNGKSKQTITSNDIQDHLNQLYGIDVSPALLQGFEESDGRFKGDL